MECHPRVTHRRLKCKSNYVKQHQIDSRNYIPFCGNIGTYITSISISHGRCNDVHRLSAMVSPSQRIPRKLAKRHLAIFRLNKIRTRLTELVNS